MTVSAPAALSSNFSGTLKGRCGYITYIGPPCILKFYWEGSGSPDFDVLILGGQVTGEGPLTIPSDDERLVILEGLRSWIAGHGLRSNIDVPPDPSDDTALCLNTGCTNLRMKGFYICKRHYDLGCIELKV